MWIFLLTMHPICPFSFPHRSIVPTDHEAHSSQHCKAFRAQLAVTDTIFDRPELGLLPIIHHFGDHQYTLYSISD